MLKQAISGGEKPRRLKWKIFANFSGRQPTETKISGFKLDDMGIGG